MKTAKQNIEKLPAECWGVLKIDNSIIKIKAGEIGYHKVSQPIHLLQKKQSNILKETDHLLKREEVINDFVDELNKGEGVTTYQRKAMEFGSQFGFEVKAADPDFWKEMEKTNLPKSIR